MAAERVYTNAMDTQDSRPESIKKSWERVMRISYGGAMDQMVGAQLWGTHELDTNGLHNEMLFHTGLQGTAVKVEDDVRQRFPMAGYKTGSILIRGYNRLGIAYEYYPEDLEDVLENMKFIQNLVGELPLLLSDAEEEEHHHVYNNGETYTSGIFNTPLFVDGDSNKLQLLGRPDYFSGTAASNIIEGGVSYALFAKIHQYGDNFVNEEGRLEAVEVDMYTTNDQNADLIELYYSASFNIESGNSNMRNPLSRRRTPRVIRSKRMANSMDIWVFFEGWQMFMKERNKYRGREGSWTEGHEQYQKVVAQIRSRYGYYFINNRLLMLVKGAG